MKISNESAHTLQLLSRHWVIVEKSGLVAEVGPKARVWGLGFRV